MSPAAPPPEEGPTARGWRRRQRQATAPVPPLTYEEALARLAEQTAAADQATSLRRAAELAAAEQAAERLVAEEAARAAATEAEDAHRRAGELASAAAEA
ncbi:hypothetical protein, partial [Nocardioides marmotae]|uniref:hypothetical protein n=1 Tax=Nocardioides marmotae TaxID=2663857 RepID=UPI00132CB95C